MRTKTETHHKYEKMTWDNGKVFYKCMIPGCPHYLPNPQLAVNRESLCWGIGCNKLVVITKDDVLREVKHPMCEECKEKRATRREELGKI